MNKKNVSIGLIILLTSLFSSCFFKKNNNFTAVIIRPSTEELESFRNEKLNKIETQAKISIEANKNKKRFRRTLAENIYLGVNGGLLSVHEVENFFDAIEAKIVQSNNIKCVDNYIVRQVLNDYEFDISKRKDKDLIEEINKELNADILIFFDSNDFFPSDNVKDKVILLVNVDFINPENFSKNSVTISGRPGYSTEIEKSDEKKLLKAANTFQKGLHVKQTSNEKQTPDEKQTNASQKTKESTANKTKYVAAVIKPSTEYLETERDKLWKQIEQNALADNEKYKNSIAYFPTIYQCIYNDGKESPLFSVAEIEKFFSEIEEQISEKNDVTLIDRNRIDEVLKQHDFEMSLWSDDEKVAEVGKALNANMLIFLESSAFFPLANAYNGRDFLRSINVEFFNINTFAKKIVVVEKGKTNFEFIDHWTKTKGKLKEVNLNF